jgi:hypothetical protein
LFRQAPNLPACRQAKAEKFAEDGVGQRPASLAQNPILCLHFNKFTSQDQIKIRKNKGRNKTEKPDRRLAFLT